MSAKDTDGVGYLVSVGPDGTVSLDLEVSATMRDAPDPVEGWCAFEPEQARTLAHALTVASIQAEGYDVPTTVADTPEGAGVLESDAPFTLLGDDTRSAVAARAVVFETARILAGPETTVSEITELARYLAGDL